MAQRVASLYAEIGADTGGLEKGLARTKDELQDTATAAKGTGLRFTEMASMLNVAGQAFGLVSGAAKFAYATISEGAELEAAASKFDNLSSSINTTGDALLGKMRSATKGMVSDAELVAAGTDIISLGLAKTESGVVRMSAAVGALNLDMGVLALTLANDSTARLDSLGLSLVDVTRKKEELIASGFIGDAFDEAVLISLEEKMTLLGDASETTAGQLKITEAAIANLTDEAKKLVAVQAGPLISSLAGAVTGQNKVNEGISAGVITMKEWNAIVNAAPDIQRGNALAIEEVNKRLEAQNAITEEASRKADEYLQYQMALSGAFEDTTDAAQGLTIEQMYGVAAQDAANEATKEGIRITAQNAFALEKDTKARAIATDAMKEQRDALIEVRNTQNEAAAAATAAFDNSFVDALNDTTSAYGRWVTTATVAGGRTEEQEANFEDLTKAAERLRENINSLQGGTAGLGLTEDELNSKLAENYEKLAQVEGAMGPLASITTEYTDAQSRWIVDAEVLNENLFNQVAGMSDNAVVTASAAIALGLYDEAQIETALNAAIMEEKINALAEAFVNGDITAGQMKERMDEIVENSPYTSEIDVLVGEAISNIDKVKSKLDAINGFVAKASVVVTTENRTSGSAADAAGGSNDGTPSGGGGGGNPGGGARGSYATGGVVPGPMGMPQLAVVHGGEEVLTPAQRNTRGGGGDITISFAGAIFQGTTQQQAAQMVSMVAEQLGVLQ